MSTRSGKRIHNYINDENTENDDVVLTQKNEVKSRKKKKENNALEVSLPKVKKRNNYVSYPTENDGIDAYASSDITEGLKPLKSRKLPRSTLKEVNVLPAESTSPIESKKRLTRHTKKFAENGDESVNDDTTIPDKAPHTEVTNIKKKMTKMEIENDQQEAVVVPKKKKSKKKRGRKGKKESHEKQNKSTTSVDSFHSAIDSPLKKNDVSKTSLTQKPNSKLPAHLDEQQFEKQDEHNKSSVLDKSNKSVLNDTVEKSNKKRKSSNKRATYELVSTSIEEPPVSNIVSDVDQATVLNNTLEKKSKKKKTSLLTVTDNKDSASINEPVVLNSTFDKGNNSAVSEKLNTTLDGVKKRKSIRISNIVSETLNSTYDKTTKEDSKTISLNSTYDKDSNPKLDTTFDKLESKFGSGKSSLITSDDTVNITLDKSDDNSRISLTSDESKTENIVNTTPVLIESSMDESRISEMSQDKSTSKDTSLRTELPQNNTQNVVVPLMREGTFTKDGPEIKTPTKRMTLPTPGSTPYHSDRVSQKKSVLNVTRSIEKSRRSSLADLAPRQTRVMFCSPMNSPTVETQHKKKIIKSSLKGSNKSFVFNDTALSRPNARKRSYTHNDADAARAKRSRLADDLQQSVDRLSRPRTVSAVVKPSAPITPTKKPVTPTAKSANRTRLPNFAALHQKQFDRMESLDECQQRKRRRAKQLLTPNGGMQVLERSSPRDTPPTAAKETPKVAKPADSTTKPLPTLESLRPGYTRFGFKMNIGVNPFGSPSKVAKPVEKPNGLKRQATLPVNQRNGLKRPAALPLNQPNGLKRQATLPSLIGTTASRREVAKQAVMREKSFSLAEKRKEKREETRTVIKGVRTNRRFELQMKHRNVN